MRALPVPYRTVAEAKPDVVYLVDGASELRFSEAFVSGAVVDVTPGRGFSWTFDDDIETRVEHKFNGEGAQVSTVHLTVSVDHAVTVPSERDLSGSTITVGLALAAPVDLAAIHRELVGGDKIVALLVHSPVFDYEPAVWAVLDDGEFLGRVGSNGAVSFPRSLSERGLVPRDLTLKALSKPAPPGPPIAVSAAGGVLARAN